MKVTERERESEKEIKWVFRGRNLKSFFFCTGVYETLLWVCVPRNCARGFRSLARYFDYSNWLFEYLHPSFGTRITLCVYNITFHSCSDSCRDQLDWFIDIERQIIVTTTTKKKHNVHRKHDDQQNKKNDHSWNSSRHRHVTSSNFCSLFSLAFLLFIHNLHFSADAVVVVVGTFGWLHSSSHSLHMSLLLI